MCNSHVHVSNVAASYRIQDCSYIYLRQIVQTQLDPVWPSACKCKTHIQQSLVVLSDRCLWINLKVFARSNA